MRGSLVRMAVAGGLVGATLASPASDAAVGRSRATRASPLRQPATAPAELEELRAELDAIDRKAGAIRDLTARFEQRKFSPLMVEPIVTTGTIRSRGAVVVWTSDGPDAPVTRVTPERLQIYYPAQKLLEEYPIAGRLGTLAASPLPRLAALREQFSLRRDAGEGLPESPGATVALRLDPSAEDVARYVRDIRVRLDPARGLLTAFEMTDPDDERTIITFAELKTDAGLTDADLELRLPKDVRVVRPLGGAGGVP